MIIMIIITIIIIIIIFSLLLCPLHFMNCFHPHFYFVFLSFFLFFSFLFLSLLGFWFDLISNWFSLAHRCSSFLLLASKKEAGIWNLAPGSADTSATSRAAATFSPPFAEKEKKDEDDAWLIFSMSLVTIVLPPAPPPAPPPPLPSVLFSQGKGWRCSSHFPLWLLLRRREQAAKEQTKKKWNELSNESFWDNKKIISRNDNNEVKFLPKWIEEERKNHISKKKQKDKKKEKWRHIGTAISLA